MSAGVLAPRRLVLSFSSVVWHLGDRGSKVTIGYFHDALFFFNADRRYFSERQYFELLSSPSHTEAFHHAVCTIIAEAEADGRVHWRTTEIGNELACYDELNAFLDRHRIPAIIFSEGTLDHQEFLIWQKEYRPRVVEAALASPTNRSCRDRLRITR